jgi:hypothetical protein
MVILDERGVAHLAPMEVFSVCLTAWHVRQARRMGSGNMSMGIRIAIESYEKRRRKILPFQTERRIDDRRTRGG